MTPKQQHSANQGFRAAQFAADGWLPTADPELLKRIADRKLRLDQPDSANDQATYVFAEAFTAMHCIRCLRPDPSRLDAAVYWRAFGCGFMVAVDEFLEKQGATA